MNHILTDLQQRYLEELYKIENYTDRFGAPGFRKIARIIGHTPNDCSKFRSTLETLGIVKTQKIKNIQKNIVLIKDFKTAVSIISRSIVVNKV